MKISLQIKMENLFQSAPGLPIIGSVGMSPKNQAWQGFAALRHAPGKNHHGG